jgi:hypothetical protein
VSHDDFDFEPTPGLPAPLPAGERLLWQGTPNWRDVALRAYHVRKVALYFGALTAGTLLHGLLSSSASHDTFVSCGLLLLSGSVAVAVLSLLAYLASRATVYTLTSQRVLIRHGIAVPMTLNLPLKRIDGVALRSAAHGRGDLALTTGGEQRVGYLITWPHVRASRFTRPQPSLLAIADARAVAERLVEAMTPEGRTPERVAAKPQASLRPDTSFLPGAVA